MTTHHQEYQRKPWQFNVPIPSTPSYVPTTRVSWDDTKIYATTGSVLNATAPAGSSCLNSSLGSGGGDAYYCTGSNHECCSGNDVVLIKVGILDRNTFDLEHSRGERDLNLDRKRYKIFSFCCKKKYKIMTRFNRIFKYFL